MEARLMLLILIIDTPCTMSRQTNAEAVKTGTGDDNNVTTRIVPNVYKRH